MENSIILSKRLLKVASYIQKGARFADIGSDHAYLPCYICLKDHTARAVAGEVNKGPYNSAVKTVNAYDLIDVIDVRLGNGLEVLRLDDSLDHIVIAGMGGSLIKDILESGIDKLRTVKRIIAQPNIDARNVRKWLILNNYQITDENILEENGHIYEVIVADKIQSKLALSLSDKELLFGPILLNDRNDTFYAKWKHEYEKLQKIVNQMKKAKEPNKVKINQFKEELGWIEEVIKSEE